MRSQLILPIDLEQQQTLDSFDDSANTAVVNHLHKLLLSRVSSNKQAKALAYSGVFLWGESGAGKSHLLSALAQLSEQSGLGFEILQSGQSSRLIQTDACVYLLDEVESFIPEQAQNLLTAIEEIKQKNALLLLSARAPIKQLGIELKDLLSRLLAMESFEINCLQEAQKREVLLERAKQRGIILNDEVLNWLFSHTSRNLSQLLNLLDQIDSHSLAEQRRVTIPLIKAVLGMGKPKLDNS